MHTIWKGMISFGLVNIPVKLYTATRDHSISFRNLCPEHHEPLKYKRWCPKGEHEVDYNEIQKGYEISDEYVVIEKEELDKLKLESSSTIDIDKFVNTAEVPILAYDKFYYVVPKKGGQKAYSLLHEVLTLTGNMAIGKVVLRNKEYLVGIKNYKKGMILITLRYADEIVDVDKVLPEKLPEPTEKEEDLAKTLVDKLTSNLTLSQYEDRYRNRVQELVEKKLKGESIEIEKVAEVEETKDILDALEKSIEQK